MTDNEIRIAIAEACPHLMCRATDTGRWLFKLNGYFVESDPLNDLNALREAVKSLQPSQQDAMDHYLHLIVERDDDIFVWNASARQMREAFLRAIGKWKE